MAPRRRGRRPDERVAAALEDAARVAYARSGYRSAAAMLERAAR